MSTLKGLIFLISSSSDVSTILTSVIIISLICFIYHLSNIVYFSCFQMITWWNNNIHALYLAFFLFSICLWDSSVLLYIDKVAYFNDIKYPIVQTQNISIYSTENGHLKCFCFEAITNNNITFFYIYTCIYMLVFL